MVLAYEFSFDQLSSSSSLLFVMTRIRQQFVPFLLDQASTSAPQMNLIVERKKKVQLFEKQKESNL